MLNFCTNMWDGFLNLGLSPVVQRGQLHKQNMQRFRGQGGQESNFCTKWHLLFYLQIIIHAFIKVQYWSTHKILKNCGLKFEVKLLQGSNSYEVWIPVWLISRLQLQHWEFRIIVQLYSYCLNTVWHNNERFVIILYRLNLKEQFEIWMHVFSAQMPLL